MILLSLRAAAFLAAAAPAPAAADTQPQGLFPTHRLVAFYGNPLSTRMGILGELPPEEMFKRLERQAAEWQQADTSVIVMPALELIAVSAQGQPGGDGKYRLRMPDSLIAKVAGWAESHGWQLILDIQPGRSRVEDEVPRLLKWLEKPWIHLGLDPEFAMPPDRVPGIKIGTLDAREINWTIEQMARFATARQLPPKVLVVHRFTVDMLTNAHLVRPHPRVQVVVQMDGWGKAALKRQVYTRWVARKAVQYTGYKVFLKKDVPVWTPAQVLDLSPAPLFISYQ